MANVNDTNATGRKLENAWRKLYEADIDERDRGYVEEFVRSERQTYQGCKRNTLIADLGNLRRAAEWSERPLVEWEYQDFKTFLGFLTRPKKQGGRELDPSGSGVQGYKQSLKELFVWLNGELGEGRYNWVERIKSTPREDTPITEDDVLSEQEVGDLKRAATNPRDRALIEFLADTSARISLASQLRVGSLHDLETNRPEYVPNPEGESQKDAPIRRYPILDSRADLRAYLNHYHVDPRDEAPLWPINRGYDYDDPDNGALSGDRIRDILKECAARAGVTKPVNPHNFRHTAVSRLSKAGYTPDEIKQFTGWKNNRMLERYTHVTDRDRNDQIHVKAGYLDEAETGTGPIAPKVCGNCREKLKQTERFCPNCGFGATADAHVAAKRLDEQFLESAALASGETARELLVVRRLLDELPALREVLSDD